MEPTGGKPGKTACSPCCGEEPPERIGRREPGQSSPYCEEFLLPGATSPPGTIKTIGFRLPTCRASNFPRTAGRNSTHRPQVRHDGSLPRTVEGETLHSRMAGPSPMKSPCAISTQGLWKGRLHPKTGRDRGNPLRRDSLSSLRLNCPSTRTSRFPSSRQWRSSRVRRR